MKKISVILSMAVLITLIISATKPSTQNKKPGEWQNLQVLPKNISEDSLDKIMDHFKEALGVRCNFCHVNNGDQWNFAADDKEEKGITRYMMTMTMEINKKYFNWDSTARPESLTTIKCITCHQGNIRPPHSDENKPEEKKE